MVSTTRYLRQLFNDWAALTDSAAKATCSKCGKVYLFANIAFYNGDIVICENCQQAWENAMSRYSSDSTLVRDMFAAILYFSFVIAKPGSPEQAGIIASDILQRVIAACRASGYEPEYAMSRWAYSLCAALTGIAPHHLPSLGPYQKAVLDRLRAFESGDTSLYKALEHRTLQTQIQEQDH